MEFSARTSLRTFKPKSGCHPFPMRKRETELIFNDKVVKDLKDKIENHVGNLTCILQNMNYTCLPVKRMKTALSENLKRVMHFIKCSEEQRNLACLKHTLRRERNKFQTQELNEGLFSLLQEDERLLAIIWSNYLTKVPEQYAYDMVY
ncbi:hypothetical protein Avbf_07572 [Armadillidium vulgare]|nr:hypothetical protein Avbf_07572 [Armadillidium vulgare]